MLFKYLAVELPSSPSACGLNVSYNPPNVALATTPGTNFPVSCAATTADLKPLDTFWNTASSPKKPICTPLFKKLTSVTRFSVFFFAIMDAALFATCKAISSSAVVPLNAI